jgi:hypothetical protein
LASVNRIPYKLKRGLYHSAEWGEVTGDDGDTFTVNTISTATSAILEALLIRMDTGANTACTHAEASPNGNRVTIGGADDDIKYLYIVYGVKA